MNWHIEYTLKIVKQLKNNQLKMVRNKPLKSHHEPRFNYRKDNMYKLLLKIIRNNPLK